MTSSLRKRLSVFGLIRLLIGFLGLGGFVVGVVVAWHSKSASTLLIVSAILLLLAALGLDWNKIRGRYGGWTVELLRDIGARIDQVTANAANEEVSPAIREELETLRAEVKALTPERPRRRPSQSPPPTDALIRELMTPKATHSFQGRDAVRLSLRVSARNEARYRCTVAAPTGNSSSAVTRRALNTGLASINTFTVTYPDEFNGSEPLVPGLYTVEWRMTKTLDGMSNRLLAMLAETAAPPIATDSFTIPEPIVTGPGGEPNT